MANTGKLIEKEGLKALFGQWEREMNGERQTALHRLRQSALEALMQADYPTTRHEEWKYTNVAELVQADWAYQAGHQVNAQEVSELLYTDAGQVALMVFVNGIYQPDLSNIGELGAGVEAMPLQEAAKQYPDLMSAHLGKHAAFEQEAFLALSTAFASEGAFLRVARSKVAERPLVLLHIADARAEQPLQQPRNLLIIEENAQATIVEQFVSLGEKSSLTNAVTEVVVAQRAVVDHYTLQVAGQTANHVGATHAYQAGNSHFSNTTISLSGGLIRNNLNLSLDGEYCEGYMNGLYMLDGETHVDNHTVVDHLKPNSYSNELYKGMLDGRSKGVFNGKIFVRKDAQKTNAFQSNNNILLSDNASADTKPQLEIWADDVKCSHGATIGALDEEPMFYLRSRGIGEDKARSLLMYAFAGDVLDRIKQDAVRTYVDNIISERLS